MIPAIPVLEGLIGIGKELIVDKDKAVEFEYKAKELMTNHMDTLIAAQTTPWVDATVKLMDAIVTLTRPLVSTALFIYGLMNPDVMAQLANIGAPGELAVGATFSALPAWGYSRHVEKIKKAEPVHPDERF